MAKKAIPTDEEILIKALPQDEEIRTEYNRLLGLFKDADPATVALHRKTLARSAFLAVTVDRLERDIAAHGYQQEYNNGGGQSGYKKSVAADLLPNYTKLYLQCQKTLEDALSKVKPMEEDELEEWLKRNGDEFDRF